MNLPAESLIIEEVQKRKISNKLGQRRGERSLQTRTSWGAKRSIQSKELIGSPLLWVVNFILKRETDGIGSK